MESPQFSVIITSHNQAKFIADAVNSALTQRCQSREIILVDDASTDGSAALLGRFQNALTLIALPRNIGATAARNRGASMAQGDYLVFLDGDDMLTPWALDTYATVAAATQPNIILTLLHFFDAPNPSAPGSMPREITFAEYENLIQKTRAHRASASATIVKRSEFERVGGWSAELFHLDDLDIMMKLGVSGRCVQIISPPTTYYRVHGGNTVNQVTPFIAALLVLIGKEKSGKYPGGAKFRFERYAVLGGPILFWIRRSIRARSIRNAVVLLLHGWSMILAAVARRFFTLISSKRPVQALTIQ